MIENVQEQKLSIAVNYVYVDPEYKHPQRLPNTSKLKNQHKKIISTRSKKLIKVTQRQLSSIKNVEGHQNKIKT